MPKNDYKSLGVSVSYLLNSIRVTSADVVLPRSRENKNVTVRIPGFFEYMSEDIKNSLKERFEGVSFQLEILPREIEENRNYESYDIFFYPEVPVSHISINFKTVNFNS